MALRQTGYILAESLAYLDRKAKTKIAARSAIPVMSIAANVRLQNAFADGRVALATR